MPKSQSKRAIEGRKWRVEARQKRKLNTVVTEYVKLKHKLIYEKCSNFYDSIIEKYPQNQNLTKTFEFRLLLEGYTQAAGPCSKEVDESAKAVDDQTDYSKANSIGEGMDAIVNQNISGLEIVQPETDHDQADNNEADSSKEDMDAIVNQNISGLEVVQPETVHDQADNNEANSSEEDMNAIVNQIINDLEVVQPEIVHDQVDNNEANSSEEDMDAIVNQIINDLEEVQPDIFLPTIAEDEGIDLNVDDTFYELNFDDYIFW